MEPAHKSSRKIFSIVAYLLMALALAYMLMHRFMPTLIVGMDAPLNDKISHLSGTPFSLNGLKKPLLINFWASWCQPCRQELRILSRLAQKYQARMSFVGIAVNSPKAEILALKNSLNLNYLLAQGDDQIVKLWQAQALPTTYLIDASGRIAWAHSGIISEEELEKNLNTILKN